MRRRCCVKTLDQDGCLRLRRIYARLYYARHAESVNIDPMSASKTSRSRTRHKTWAKVPRTKVGLHINRTTVQRNPEEMSFQGPINNRLRGNNQVTGALLVPCIQRTRLPLPDMGNALSHFLIPVWANLEYGTSGIQPVLVGCRHRAEYIGVFIANFSQNGIMHDVFAPETLMYIGDGPIVSNRKDHRSEALQ